MMEASHEVGKAKLRGAGGAGANQLCRAFLLARRTLGANIKTLNYQ
jgi:hypothetical protein